MSLSVRLAIAVGIGGVLLSTALAITNYKNDQLAVVIMGLALLFFAYAAKEYWWPAKEKAGRVISEKEWRDFDVGLNPMEHKGLAAVWLFSTQTGPEWMVDGGTDALRVRCKILCAQAGIMMLQSPKLAKQLPPEIRDISDPKDRWLSWVWKETHGQRDRGSLDDLIESCKATSLRCSNIENS